MTIRAFSTLQVKSLDEDQRVIRGIASTPSPDRMDDIVEPKGATFSLPLPFLWQHDQRQPIGHVTKAAVTADGIEVEVQLAKVDEEGKLKDRLEEAWQSIKAGLVRGMSIGFRPLESTDIEGSWGRRFTKWEWFELSAVTIPANADASIVSVKSHAWQQGAASGHDPAAGARVTQPAGATATPTQKSAATSGAEKMTIREMIEAARAQLQHKSARMEQLVTKGAETGETMGEPEQNEFDTLNVEVKSLQAQIERLEAVEATKVKAAAPVHVQPASVVEVKAFAPVVKAPPLKDGLAVARYARYLGLAKGNIMLAEQMAKQNSREHPQVVEMVKAAVVAGTTTGSTWAQPLVPQEGGAFADFLEYLRPRTIVGQFGSGSIPSLRRIPFRVRLLEQTSGGAAYWTGEGAGKGLTKFDFDSRTLEPLKIAAISVITEELLADSSPSADAIIRDQLVAAARARLDTDFIDPAKAASAGISPASITNGVTPITASGTTADALRADIKDVMAQFLAALNAPTSGVWIMDSITALGISLMRNALGTGPEFPGLTITGGTLEGLPAIVSDFVPRDSSGGSLILVNAQDIYFGDDGDFTVDFSREASLQMDSAPTMNSTTPTATSVVSMWQTNSVAFRVERRLNWMKRRASAVAWVDNTNYGG